ncbi:hypothetical protein V1523DRAFT_422286 [Lipomyces doorenjongii]
MFHLLRELYQNRYMKGGSVFFAGVAYGATKLLPYACSAATFTSIETPAAGAGVGSCIGIFAVAVICSGISAAIVIGRCRCR